ncbi:MULTISPECIES: DUF732 domain-containing protein [Mycobacterium]|uniref:DUF732 domain-containing protein n=1 Tax=Mycobacterium kiyosense TaxID=2871094 RepID=A0A9P3Q219_9MYCO|nr:MULTISPECIES: DUF732 domain-containing protein [Mycobacterium]BDB43287.1 hypothetical protein IWGMT90018_37330 [Mycobacterium kiyosense]BDE13515.1 hypothetical protein MKCMC460_23750 [Mycobacterium sp. 20KCMC460]GLB84147.1 hypothetical protein SRL2020028_34030 [Mycobacterium kiyosense]GLB88448.1 hypothetical protein SRL2020130_12650 [Mycobacterium kiyosense]GLB94627.1 hypothetical protein SRL2020226_14030 [Mycobacterium kiyosense]
MPLPRWMLGLPILVAAAVFSGTATAGASPVDDAYLAQLRAAGFAWGPEHDNAVVGMGHLICDDLYWGWSPDRIAQEVHANLDGRGVTFGQVSSMIDIARANYCNW